jgi:hypothetical protein
MPRKPVRYFTLPSSHSSLGYPRKAGGFAEGVRGLVTLGAALLWEDEEYFLKELFSFLPKNIVSRFADLYPDHPLGGKIGALNDLAVKTADMLKSVPESVPDLWMYTVMLARQETEVDFLKPGEVPTPVKGHFPMNQGKPKDARRQAYRHFKKMGGSAEYLDLSLYLRTAVFHCLRRCATLGGVPTLPLQAPEKGRKTRYPTLELAAANLVHQVFRRAADAHLVNDRRLSSDMGGHLHPPDMRKWSRPGTFWYSVDLTYATDLHPFWLTQGFYHELVDLHPELEEFREFIPVVMGPRVLLKDTPPPAPPIPGRLDLTSLMEARLPKGKEQQLKLLCHEDRATALQYRDEYSTWFEGLFDLDCDITTTGAMMGSASSFPVMPMITGYAARRAGIKLYRAVGDDGLLARVTQHSKGVFETAVQDCGGVLSQGDPTKGKPRKIFEHPNKGLFKEIPFVDGSQIPGVPISIWSGPPGGSKGSENWLTQGSSARQSMEFHRVPFGQGLWAYSPFRREVEAAYALGLPVREPVGWGGCLYGGFPHRALGNQPEWISCLNSFTLEELICGTGLSPLPTPDLSLVRKESRKWVGEVLKRRAPNLPKDTGGFIPQWWYDVNVSREVLNEEGRPRLLLADAAARVAAPLQHLSLYSQDPVEFDRVPSIRYITRRFVRRMKQQRPPEGELPPLAYRNTVISLQEKAAVYADIPPVMRVALGTISKRYGLVVNHPIVDNDDEEEEIEPVELGWAANVLTSLAQSASASG